MQKEINNILADGVVGDFYDNSPRKVDGYIVKNVEGSKAEGQITLSKNPSANDTITIGNETYKFVVSPSNDFEVEIGTDANASAGNLVNVINQLSKLVDASNNSNVITLTNKVNGNNGNGLILVASNTTDTSIVAFAGGNDNLEPQVGKVFTLQDGYAVQGGNGAYLGILINSKEYINYSNLENASLVVANNSQASICSMGRVNVKVANDVKVGYIVAFNEVGDLFGYEKEADVPSNQTIIKNAKFEIIDADAGKLAIIGLI